MAESQISNKIWNIASVLRDGGVSYGDYLEQITFLLFMKMVDENKKMADIDPELQMFSMEGMDFPKNFEWTQLAALQGEDLLDYYVKLLADLSKRKGMIGEIYRGARNKVEKASLLKKVVDMIDAVDWSSQSEDVKGDIYESLLQRIAQDTKSGAGQYFTPRALINVIVKCVNPRFNEDTRIADPCCGSGGFLLAARKYFGNTQSEKLNKALQETVFRGTEYVDSTYRMCLMNLLLHGIGTFNGVPPIKCQDSLAHAPGEGELCDYVLTNPPFGKKSSQSIEVEKKDKEGNTITVIEKENDNYTRQDFVTTTTNKQLNFVQHIKSMLKVGGQAAVVVPDNVLNDANAGEVIRQNLLKTCDLHTILRLPSGIFYAQSVKANVLFFEKRPTSNTIHTKEVWIYDYRTNIHHTLKQNPLKESDLEEFVNCYNPADRHNRIETYNEQSNPDGRWRKFSYDEIMAQEYTSLDIKWIESVEEEDTSLTLNEKMSLLSQIKDITEKYDLSDILELSPKEAYDEIIDRAIRGSLVEQKYDEEPAIELMKRICGEKQKLVKSKFIKIQDCSFEPQTGLYELPKNWCWVKISDLFTEMESTHPEGETFSYIDIDAIDNKNNKAHPKKVKSSNAPSRASRKVLKGDILFSMVRPYLRNIARVEHDNCIASTGFYVFHPLLIDSEYCYYCCLSRYFVDGLNSFMKGDNSPSIKNTVVKNYLFPLPPIEEQKRIVHRLKEIIPILVKLKNG